MENISYGQIALILFFTVLILTFVVWIVKKFINAFHRILAIIVITTLFTEASLDKVNAKEPVNIKLALASKRLLTGESYFIKSKAKTKKKTLPFYMRWLYNENKQK